MQGASHCRDLITGVAPEEATSFMLRRRQGMTIEAMNRMGGFRERYHDHDFRLAQRHPRRWPWQSIPEPRRCMAVGSVVEENQKRLLFWLPLDRLDATRFRRWPLCRTIAPTCNGHSTLVGVRFGLSLFFFCARHWSFLGVKGTSHVLCAPACCAVCCAGKDRGTQKVAFHSTGKARRAFFPSK